MLARAGAEIVKIEDPRGGDPLRAIPPLAEGTGVLFHALNTGKRSVTIDLRDRRGRRVLGLLADHADAVVESFRPATARLLGVHATQLRRGRPRLVHCS